VSVRKPLRRAKPARSKPKGGGRLALKLLGTPRIERGGKAIQLDTRKATALVAYLALAGRQSRDRLAAMFWPDASNDRSRGALRRTLSVLRTGGFGDALVSDGLSVVLRDADVDVDVRRFRELVATGHLEDASAAYTGDLLAGFALRDSVEFDEWHASEADELRRELAGALERLARDERDTQKALASARRWVALDALHEPAHRALMRLLARAGDRAAALRQYRECVRTLDRDLGVTPLPETTALARAIERGQSEPEPPPPSAPMVEETVGDLYTRHGDYERAISSYETAQEKAPAAERRRLDHKLAGVHHRRGNWEKAEAHYRAALRGEDDEGLRARITADWSLAAHRRGDGVRASRLAEEALSIANRTRDDKALAQAHNIVGILRRERSHLEQSLAIAERIGDDEARLAAMNNLALAMGRAGDLATAVDLTERALALSDTVGDRHRQAALHNNLADLLKASGRRTESMRHLKRAVTLFAEIGAPGTMEPEVWKLVEW
jgi:DNA-binding SARP family transcriptional activator